MFNTTTSQIMAFTDEQAQEVLKEYLAFVEAETRTAIHEEREALRRLGLTCDVKRFVHYLQNRKTMTRDVFLHDVYLSNITSRRVTLEEQASFAVKLGPVLSRILRKGKVAVYGSVILSLLGLLEMPVGNDRPDATVRPVIHITALRSEQSQIESTLAEYDIQISRNYRDNGKVEESHFFVNRVEMVVCYDDRPMSTPRFSCFSHLKFAYDGQSLFGHGEFPLARETRVKYDVPKEEVEYWRKLGYTILDVDGNPFDDSERQKVEDGRKRSRWEWERRPCEDWRGCKRELCPCKRPSYLWFSA
jgi:hypothetical protein